MMARPLASLPVPILESGSLRTAAVRSATVLERCNGCNGSSNGDNQSSNRRDDPEDCGQEGPEVTPLGFSVRHLSAAAKVRYGHGAAVVALAFPVGA